jgi:hypothetical protein
VLDTRHADRPDRIVELVEALADMPVISETHAWLTGRARDAAVLELRLAGLVPDARPITRSDRVVAWASRRHSATIVYWPHDGALELTLDEDVDQAIATILNDIARPTRRGPPPATSTSPRTTASSPSGTVKRWASPLSRAWLVSRTCRPDRARRAG